jgi:hypothetical protein
MTKKTIKAIKDTIDHWDRKIVLAKMFKKNKKIDYVRMHSKIILSKTWEEWIENAVLFRNKIADLLEK